MAKLRITRECTCGETVLVDASNGLTNKALHVCKKEMTLEQKLALREKLKKENHGPEQP